MSTASFQAMFLEVLAHPPDRYEPQPFANRKETIYGVVIAFMLLSWIAVLFRLWVRFKVVREPGLDDAFIFFSALCNIAGTICVTKSVQHGLGHHMLYIGLPNLEQYLLTFYIENGIYCMQTTVVKLSLLVQFLRIFKAGKMRWVCIGLITIVSLWGLAFTLMGWFPCFPIRGAWDRSIGAKCYGFGYDNTAEFVSLFKAHSATNMVLDICVFLTPMIIFKTPKLKTKSLLALSGVFTFGGIVVAISVWRLYSICRHEAATYPYIDFTWWTPSMIVLSCLEIDLAIICASMPIFWPVIERRLAAIFVSYEVDVIEERVHDDYGLAYELEHTKSKGQGSMRSGSGTSMEGLTREEDDAAKIPKFSVGPDPLDEETMSGGGFQTNVEAKPRPKWEI